MKLSKIKTASNVVKNEKNNYNSTVRPANRLLHYSSQNCKTIAIFYSIQYSFFANNFMIIIHFLSI